MGVFGWSLPPGCPQLPDEEPEFEPLRCKTCGAFLNETAPCSRPDSYVETDYSSSRPIESNLIFDVKTIESPFGADDVPWFEFKRRVDYHILIWVCKKCGAKTEVPNP